MEMAVNRHSPRRLRASSRGRQRRVILSRPTPLGRVEERRGGLGLWEPSLRFLSPLIERNVRISRITLSDWLHVRPTAYMIGASVRDG